MTATRGCLFAWNRSQKADDRASCATGSPSEASITILASLARKACLDAPGIGRGQSVFGGKYPVRPICSVLGRVKVLQFGQSIAQ